MKIQRFTFTLGAVMAAVAGVAGMLALVRWDRGPFVGYPALLIGLVAAFVRWGRMTQSRALVWVVAVYPWLTLVLLYLAWGATWAVAGQRPVFETPPDPGPLVSFLKGMTGLSLIAIPFVLVVAPGLILVEIMNRVDARQTRNRILLLAAGPVVSWTAALAWGVVDPGHALSWMLD